MNREINIKFNQVSIPGNKSQNLRLTVDFEHKFVRQVYEKDKYQDLLINIILNLGKHISYAFY